MPGYVMHLAVAEEIIRNCHITDDRVVNCLLVGSIIPDAAKDNKKSSHFWTDENYKEFVRKPSLENFLIKYKDKLDNPYVFGYYAHLYMDYVFVTEYWKNHFEFYDNDMKKARLFDEVSNVKLLEDGRIIPREEFFSSSMYYGDYDRMNNYIIDKYKVRTPKIMNGSNDYSLVEEVALKEVGDNLDSMIRMVEQANKDNTYPETKVIYMSDMEELIKKVTRKLETQYKKEPLRYS